MTASVRPACYESDEPELVKLLQMNLPYRIHADYFQWLYRGNPGGEAMAWVATDPSTSRIVGAAAAFPRCLYCDGAMGRGYLLGDFCIDPGHRSLGLALSLQRACLDGLSATGADYVFDFPSHGMLAVYQRLRIPANESVVRYVKPLRADRQIESRVPIHALAQGVTSVVNAGLQLRDTAFLRCGDWTVVSENGPYGVEFTEATRKWSPAAAIGLARTAKYLNWRYREHPEQQYETITARRGGKLAGYLVYHVDDTTCIIDDLLTEGDSAFNALISVVVDIARRGRLHTISIPWPSNDPRGHLLRKCGFQPRESSPAVLLPLDRSSRPQAGNSGRAWHLSHSDWAI